MPSQLPNISSFANVSSPGGLFHIELDTRLSGCGRTTEGGGSTCLGGLGPMQGFSRTFSDLQQCLLAEDDENLTGAAAEIVRILKTSNDFEHQVRPRAPLGVAAPHCVAGSLRP